jgi:hypothetical protein
MATSVKQMLEAANAAAPKILPAQATDIPITAAWCVTRQAGNNSPPALSGVKCVSAKVQPDR